MGDPQVLAIAWAKGGPTVVEDNCGDYRCDDVWVKRSKSFCVMVNGQLRGLFGPGSPARYSAIEKAGRGTPTRAGRGISLASLAPRFQEGRRRADLHFRTGEGPERGGRRRSFLRGAREGRRSMHGLRPGRPSICLPATLQPLSRCDKDTLAHTQAPILKRPHSNPNTRAAERRALQDPSCSRPNCDLA